MSATDHADNDDDSNSWNENLEPRITDSSVYILQTIIVNGEPFTIFFDNGCKSFCCTIDAVRRLKKKTKCIQQGPKQIIGLTKTPHVIYAVKLPLMNGREVEFTGMALKRICSDFRKYPIKGMVEDDIKNQYRNAGFDPKNLPKLPTHCGGRIDFMVGGQFMKYHPDVFYQLANGLRVHRSKFKNSTGGCGVIGGPHEGFTIFESHYTNQVQSTFISSRS